MTRRLRRNLSPAFKAKAAPAGPTVHVKALHAGIGGLTLENDFSPGARG